MLCEDYILMDGILFKIRYVKEKPWKTNIGVMCSRKLCTYNSISTSYTFIGRTSMCNVNVPYGQEKVLFSYNVTLNQTVCGKLVMNVKV